MWGNRKAAGMMETWWFWRAQLAWGNPLMVLHRDAAAAVEMAEEGVAAAAVAVAVVAAAAVVVEVDQLRWRFPWQFLPLFP